MKAETQFSDRGLFKDPIRREMEEFCSWTDKAVRAGLQLTSVFLLMAESLFRDHLQFSRGRNWITDL